MPASGQSQTPAIRTFQFDGSGSNGLKKSVNLFRGDVNLNQQVLSLPGRPGKSGLDIHLSLLYQSNINEAATLWNVDHATGVVGLGWGLPMEGIIMENKDSPSPITTSYYYVGNGGENQLIQEPDTPFLFKLSGASFSDGKTIGTDNQKLFARAGILIDAKAIAKKAEKNWEIADAKNQRLYELQTNDDDFNVHEGGIAYQLKNYKFWRIIYYPVYERWMITLEDGSRKSFGGLVTGTPATGVNNSIKWGVRWGTEKDGKQVAQWVGQSASTDGQQRFAQAWYLAKVEDIWGDAVRYGYNETEIGATQSGSNTHKTGIKTKDISQKVGSDKGQSYTKALYLTHMQDVFGRKAILGYGDKIYDNSSAEAPREYYDLHKSEPDNTANPYQDQYETKFLQDITVIDTDGELLFSMDFEYNPSPSASGQNKEVANVTTNTDAMKGATFKRFLTGITKKNANGQSLPGLKFDYYLKHDAINPGALEQIIHPEGAIAKYTYTKQELDICQRRIELDPPSAVTTDGETATPYIWFGEDYAVSLWYNSVSNKLSMRVYTWLGRWVGWQYTSDSIIATPDDGIDGKSFEVIAKQNFFVLYFKSGTSTGNLYVFQKELARPGLWSPMVLDGDKKEPITFDLSQSDLSITGGNSFLAVLLKNTVDNTHEVKNYAFDWRTRAWTSWCLASAKWIKCGDCSGGNCTIKGTNVYLEAGPEYLITNEFTSDGSEITATLSLYYLDQFGQWNTGDSQQIPKIDLPNLSAVQGAISMAVGASMLAMTVKFKDSGELETDSYTLMWGGNYQFIGNPYHQSFKDDVPNDAQLPSVRPKIGGNSMVGVAGHLMHFDGQQWVVNQKLAQEKFNYGSIQHYAYGQNLGVQGIYQGTVDKPTANVQIYDPAIDNSSWKGDADKLPVGNPDNKVQRQRDNFPSTAGENYFSIGRYVYNRLTLTGSKFWEPDWPSSIANPPAALDKTLSSESIINSAPDFVCYLVQDLDDLNNYVGVQPFTIKNGQLIKQDELEDEKYYNQAEIQSASYPEVGVGPAGGGSFVTYPKDDDYFEKAQKLFLYRFAGDAFAGKISHRAVATLSTGDGYGLEQSSYYDFDTSTATCDASGKIVKYYNSKVYAGTTTKKGAKSGYLAHQYFNGYKKGAEITTYSPDQSKNLERYDMLDGMLEKEQYFAQGQSKPVSDKTKTWRAYTRRIIHPKKNDVKLLFGGYVREIKQTHILDGVTSVKTINHTPAGLDYPYSGQQLSQAKTGYNGTGEKETHTKYKSYAYEYAKTYPVINTLHILCAVVQTKTMVKQGKAADAIAEASATVYQNYARSRQSADLNIPGSAVNFMYRGPGPFTDFPTSKYQSGKVPAGWALHSSVVARTNLGLTSETKDAGGFSHSVLYDEHEQFMTASFANASLKDQTCIYAGFESYEDAKNWSISGSAKVISDNANTGSGSLQLPGARAGALKLNIQVPLKKETQTYILGFWLKTPTGFTTDKSSSWKVGLKQGSTQVGQTSAVVFANTKNEWAYFTGPIAIPAGSGTATLTAAATNKSDGDVWLDDVHINPILCQFTAQVYDPAFKYISAAHHGGGRIKRNLRDQFHRIVIQTASGQKQAQQVKAAQMSYLSRQGNSDSKFDPATPNSRLIIHPSTSGSFANFLSGDSWQKVWTASKFSDDWKQENGSLVSKKGSKTTLSLATATTGDPWAVYLELTPPASGSDTYGFHFGDKQQIIWNESKKAFQFLDGSNVVQKPLSSPPSAPMNWTLIQTKKQFLFYGDGNLIFSVAAKPASGQHLVFHSGGNPITFHQLAHMVSPKVSVNFTDAQGKSRQTQDLVDGDAWVAQTIYDEHGRAVVQTKTAPASFGSGNGKPIMQYRDGFVKGITNFVQKELAGTGVMKGDVADYYQGKAVGKVTPSNDEGYPYFRKRFEASPLARLIEKGQAGKALAIVSPDSTSSSKRPTFQYAYSKNDTDMTEGSSSLPTGQYHLEQSSAPLKNHSIKLISIFHQPVAMIQVGTDNKTKLQTRFNHSYSKTGKVTKKLLPNYFSTSPQEDPDSFIVTQEHNFLQQLISQTSQDAGTTLYMYDQLGHLRFEKPNQKDTPFLIYHKYDALGRKIETGTSAFDWNDSTAKQLQEHANDPDWPTKGSSSVFTPACTTEYDGDGKTPSTIGLPVKITTINEREDDTKIEVTEQYTYYIDGEVKDVSTAISDDSRDKQTISYEYDNSQNPTLIHLPKGQIETIQYSYDELGNLAGIGTSKHPTAFASYQYDPELQLSKEVLSDGELTGLFQHFPPGWLDNYAYSPAADSSYPAHANYDYKYDHNQAIKSISSQITDGHTKSPYEAAVTYDPTSRVKQTKVSSDSSLDSQIEQYDDNGNIYQIKRGDDTLAISYQKGTDQPTSVKISGGSAQKISFDAQGRVTQAPQVAADKVNHFRYDESLKHTAGITVQDGDKQTILTFAYGDKGKRVLKSVKTKKGHPILNRLYLHGTAAQPLMEMDADGTITTYVYGRGQLVAFMRDDKKYTVIRDKSGSVRAVLDAKSGTIEAAYTYFAFGGVKAAGKQPAVLDYLYTGQEFDRAAGLYNYRARFYDPWLGRFYASDPAHQYASPYAYTGNNPINLTDPSGMFSFGDLFHGYQAGMLVGAAEIGAGVLLTATGFGSVYGGALIAMGATGMVNSYKNRHDFKWKQFGESEVGTAIGFAEVNAGVIVTVLTAGALGSTVGGGLIGAGMSGMSYSTFHKGNFNWGDYAKQEAIGAVGGLVTGGVGAFGSGIGAALDVGEAGQVAIDITSGVVGGVASTYASKGVRVGLYHQSWQFSWWTLLSAGEGGALGGLGGGVGAYFKGKLPGSQMDALPENPTAFDKADAFFAQKHYQEALGEVSPARRFFLGKEGKWFPANNAKRLAALVKPGAFNLKKFHPSQPEEKYPPMF